MVIGNKCDMDDERVVSIDQAKRVVKDNLGDDIEIIETSAKDATNVNDAFAALAKKALERL